MPTAVIVWRAVTWRLPRRCTSLDVVRQLALLVVVGLLCWWLALDNGLSHQEELILSVPALWAMARFAAAVARWDTAPE